MKIIFVSLPVTKSDVDKSRFASDWKSVLSSSDLFENIVYTSPNWIDILHDLEFPERSFIHPFFLSEKERGSSILDRFSEECFFFGEEWSFLTSKKMRRGVLSIVDTTDDVFFFYHIATERELYELNNCRDSLLCTMLWPDNGFGSFTIRMPGQCEGRVHKKVVSHKRILPTLLYLSNSEMVDDPEELLFSSRDGAVCLQVWKDPYQSFVFFLDEKECVLKSVLEFGSSDVISNMNPHVRFLKDSSDSKNTKFRSILEREKASVIRVNRQMSEASTQTDIDEGQHPHNQSKMKDEIGNHVPDSLSPFFKDFNFFDKRRGTCFLLRDGNMILSNNSYLPSQLVSLPFVTDEDGNVMIVKRIRNDSVLIDDIRVFLFTFVSMSEGGVLYRCERMKTLKNNQKK